MPQFSVAAAKCPTSVHRWLRVVFRAGDGSTDFHWSLHFALTHASLGGVGWCCAEQFLGVWSKGVPGLEVHAPKSLWGFCEGGGIHSLVPFKRGPAWLFPAWPLLEQFLRARRAQRHLETVCRVVLRAVSSLLMWRLRSTVFKHFTHANSSPFGEIRHFEYEMGDLRDSCRYLGGVGGGVGQQLSTINPRSAPVQGMRSHPHFSREEKKA